MEQPQEQRTDREYTRSDRKERRRAPSNAGEGGYRSVARQAVSAESEVKLDSGPAVSFTVVGENVTFTQHFNF